eukprot:1082956-Amphidinium_carterae.3
MISYQNVMQTTIGTTSAVSLFCRACAFMDFCHRRRCLCLRMSLHWFCRRELILFGLTGPVITAATPLPKMWSWPCDRHWRARLAAAARVPAVGLPG